MLVSTRLFSPIETTTRTSTVALPPAFRKMKSSARRVCGIYIYSISASITTFVAASLFSELWYQLVCVGLRSVGELPQYYLLYLFPVLAQHLYVAAAGLFPAPFPAGRVMLLYV